MEEPPSSGPSQPEPAASGSALKVEGKKSPSKTKSRQRIKPSEAVALLAPAVGGTVQAKEYIADMLRDGVIVAVSPRRWTSRETDLRDAWNDHAPSGTVNKYLVISRRTWRMSCDWERDYKTWKWDTSRFFVTKSEKPYPERKMYSGVRFYKDEIDRLVSVAVKGFKSRGGGPHIDLAKRKRAWVSALHLYGDKAKLTKPNNVASMIEDILAEGAARFDETGNSSPFGPTIATEVAHAIWEHFREAESLGN